MFRRLKLSSAAKQDLRDIQATSRRLFGAQQAIRYKRLITQALIDIDTEPERPGSQERPEFGTGFRTYRVEPSRTRSGTGVKSSHHVVVYIVFTGDNIGISRVLHDSMLMGEHIPEPHKEGDDRFFSDEEE